MIETTQSLAANAFKNYRRKKTTDNRVTQSIAEKFIGALTELESARDVELMVVLFADDCEVGNVAASKEPDVFGCIAATLSKFFTPKTITA